MHKYITSDIFTPTSPATYTFVERISINNILVDSLRTKGKQIIVFGHSGTGKTTLLHNKLRQVYEDFISTRCTTNLTFEQLVLTAFDQLGQFFISSQSNAKNTKLTSTITADFANIKNSIGYERTDIKNTEFRPILPPQLTPQRLASYFGLTNSCWVIEDFHKMESKEKLKLAQYMKVFMDESVNFPEVKIIAIGAVGTAKEVLSLDKELNNRVSEIEVPFMNNSELHEIISIGETKLNIKIANEVKNKIVEFSMGLPAITHQLCLNLCQNAGIYETSDNVLELDKNDFKDAMASYLLTNSGFLHDRYEKATKETNKYHLPIYYHIIRCFTTNKKNNLTVQDVSKYFKENMHPQPEAGIEYVMQQLTKDKRGEALKYDEPSKTWSIADPFFRVYCISAMEFSILELQSQYDLFSKETLEKQKRRAKQEQKEFIRKALQSGNIGSIIDF